MNDPILSPCPQRTPARKAPESPLSSIPYPLSPAVSARNTLLLLCLLFLLTACGRRPGQPTPLPAGTRVAQNTPDFSAPAQAESATHTADQVADSLRARLAQQRTQTAPTASPAASADANPATTPSAPYPSLAVFSRPTALGILSAGGLLYSAPGAGVLANLQIGATLTITGRSANGAWFAAYLADGIAGWVPAAQVRVFGDASELEIVQESLGPAVVATLIAEASKPQDPITTVVVRLPRPTPATTPAAPPPRRPPAEITGPAVTVLVEGANLRAGPGTDFPVVGGLYQNESAPLLGRNQTGDWLQVQLPASPAWIFASRQPCPSPTSPSSTLPQNPRPPPDRPPRPHRSSATAHPPNPINHSRQPSRDNPAHRRTPTHRPSPRPRTLAHPLTAPRAHIAAAQITAHPPNPINHSSDNPVQTTVPIAELPLIDPPPAPEPSPTP